MTLGLPSMTNGPLPRCWLSWNVRLVAGVAGHREGITNMYREFQRLSIELDLFSARRRADEYKPFSLAWDAAIAEVENLERDLWRLDAAAGEPVGRAMGASEPSRP